MKRRGAKERVNRWANPWEVQLVGSSPSTLKSQFRPRRGSTWRWCLRLQLGLATARARISNDWGHQRTIRIWLKLLVSAKTRSIGLSRSSHQLLKAETAAKTRLTQHKTWILRKIWQIIAWGSLILARRKDWILKLVILLCAVLACNKQPIT